MPITVYSSTDASAPVLTGAPGSMIALLTSCLVNGYGSKAGAGWTKPYTGTNVAAFRMSVGTYASENPIQSTGGYLYVGDTSVESYRFASMYAYTSMSSITTGLGRYPTTGTRGILKGYDDSTPTPWVLVASHRSFYLFTYPYTTDATIADGTATLDYYNDMFFGDFTSYVTNGVDQYRCMLICGVDGTTNNALGHHFANWGVSAQRDERFIIARNVIGLKIGQYASIARRGPYAEFLDELDPVTGGLNTISCDIYESTAIKRGTLPGLIRIYGGSLYGSHKDTLVMDNADQYLMIKLPGNKSVGIRTSGNWY